MDIETHAPDKPAWGHPTVNLVAIPYQPRGHMPSKGGGTTGNKGCVSCDGHTQLQLSTKAYTIGLPPLVSRPARAVLRNFQADTK
jgi:hypothetical protein